MSKSFEVILPNGLRREVVLALDHDALLAEHDAMVETWADASTDLEYMTVERNALLAERDLLLLVVEAAEKEYLLEKALGYVTKSGSNLDICRDIRRCALDAYNASKEENCE